MPRYMTQDVFDALAITHAMLRLGANPSVLNKGSFSGAIEIYKQSYPDEDSQVVLTDLPAATHEVERIADDVYDAFFKGSSSDKKSAYYAVLKELRKIVKQQSQEKRPLTKRIFGGTWFNYVQSPLHDRVEKCKENVSLAAAVMMLAGTLEK
jgi:hypothetical protein